MSKMIEIKLDRRWPDLGSDRRQKIFRGLP